MFITSISGKHGGEDYQHRSHSLAPAGEHIFSDFSDQGDLRVQVMLKLAHNLLHLRFEHLYYFFHTVPHL
jgi:hypothetical protein